MCIFCDIANHQVSDSLLYEDELVVAFKDVRPIVPVHILVIPKKHIASINELPEGKEGDLIAGRLITVAKKMAKEQGIAEDGYKLLIRTGNYGGQEIQHIHLHLLGGGKMKEEIGLIK